MVFQNILIFLSMYLLLLHPVKNNMKQINKMSKRNIVLANVVFLTSTFIGRSSGAKGVGGGGGGGSEGAAPLQGRKFCSQMYFYYTNRGVHIYLAPGGNTPCSANWLGSFSLIFITGVTEDVVYVF